MKKLIVLGIAALTLAATLSPLNVEAAGTKCTQPGNSNQMVIVDGNCNIGNLPVQIQEKIKAIILKAIQNGCCNNGNTENKPSDGIEDVPNVDAPDTDAPSTDAPSTDAPSTDVPSTDAPSTDAPSTDAPSTDTPNTDNENTQNPTDSSYAQKVVDLVNAERAKEGLSPLNFDAGITNAANIRATEIQLSFSHTRPNGSNFNTVLTEQGLRYRSYGENIAYGQKTPEEVVTGWMNSAGHRANIMNKNFKNIGVGYQVKNGRAYWVQLFTA